MRAEHTVIYYYETHWRMGTHFDPVRKYTTTMRLLLGHVCDNPVLTLQPVRKTTKSKHDGVTADWRGVQDGEQGKER